MTSKTEEPALGGLIEKLAAVRAADKALAVGAERHHGWLVSLARGLRPDGLLIVFYPDAEGMRALRAEFDAAGFGGRASVMLGDPALLVRKVAGPFDVVLNCAAGDEAAWRARLMPLVRPRGLLVSAWQDGIAIVVKE